MAVADDRQRKMPLPEDRLPGRCQALAYQEAVLLVNPVDPELRGEVLHLRLSVTYTYVCMFMYAYMVGQFFTHNCFL